MLNMTNDKLPDNISSDNVVPVIKTTTSLTIQYVDSTDGRVVYEANLFNDVSSYGSTVAQALGSTSVFLNDKLEGISDAYDELGETDPLFDSEDPDAYLLDQEFLDSEAPDAFHLQELDDAYLDKLYNGEEESFYTEEYVDDITHNGSRVVDLVDFMNRGR
jgi:hypothetical protein